MQPESSDTLLKINLGCGTSTHQGWINIDSSYNAKLAKYPKIKWLLAKSKLLPNRLLEISWPDNITVMDIRRDLPYPDGSVTYVYSSHLLEHLTHKTARKLLEECYRVLTPGGAIRIVVPDLLVSIKKYMESYEKWDENSQTPSPAGHFLESLSMLPKDTGKDPLLVRAYNALYNKNTHKWAYDRQSLSYLLKSIGFKNISQKEFMESSFNEIAALDIPSRFEGAICLEAIKKT